MPRITGKVSAGPGLTRTRRARAGACPRGLLAVLLGSLLAASCSVGSEAAPSDTGTGAGTPDTVAVRVVHRVSQNGRLALELRAARAETFNDAKKTILTDARFVEFDDKGGTATVGTAKTVIYHSDSENADISGGVRVRSEVEKGVVTAEALSWENKEKRLSAPADEVVTLRKDDGTSLAGTGFNGDFRARELVFTGPVNGTYVSSDK
jgi:LPS export ABC transporter protein LptC